MDALIQNIDERFKESSPILDVLSVPAKTDDGFRYGAIDYDYNYKIQIIQKVKSLIFFVIKQISTCMHFKTLIFNFNLPKITVRVKS